MTSFDQHSFFSCGNPVDDQPCRYCTCERCGYYNIGVPCLGCNSKAENSFTYEPAPYSYNDSPNFFDYPPQPQYNTLFCELCGNDAHYGYDCPPQVPFVYNQDPCFNQSLDNFPQTSPSFPQQYLCCEDCGGPHATFQCQPMNQNIYNSFGLNQFQPPQYSVVHQPIPETNMEMMQAQDNLMEAIQALLKKFDHIPPNEKPMAFLLVEDKFLKIKRAFEQNHLENIQELMTTILNDLKICDGILLKHEKQDAPSNKQEEKSMAALLADEEAARIKALYQEIYDEVLEDIDGTIYLIDSIINFSHKIDPLLEEFAGELALNNPIPPEIDEFDFDHEEDIRLIEKLLYDNSSPRPPDGLNFEISIKSFYPSPIPIDDSDSLMEKIDTFLDSEPDRGESTRIIMGNILGEPRVHVPNVLPTLCVRNKSSYDFVGNL
ncbi:hypothetical protein Tco_0871535 [Tanacetum coccineum]